MIESGWPVNILSFGFFRDTLTTISNTTGTLIFEDGQLELEDPQLTGKRRDDGILNVGDSVPDSSTAECEDEHHREKHDCGSEACPSHRKERC